MDNFNLTEFLSNHWKQQLLKEDFRINTKYKLGDGKKSGKKFIPQHFDLQPRVLAILKREGVKMFPDRGILALPLDLYQILNIKGNRVADDIKYTFPRGKEIQASGLVSAIKKSLDRDRTMEIGGQKYYIINGTFLGDTFRIPSPYLKDSLEEWYYEDEEEEMDDVEDTLTDEPDQSGKHIPVIDPKWRKISGKHLTDLPDYKLNENVEKGFNFRKFLQEHKLTRISKGF